MDKNTVVIILNLPRRNRSYDIEVPLDITANDLVVALNSAYELKIDTSDTKKCFLKAENPIALLRGNKSLEAFGIRNGSIINYTE